ncbi:MAG: phosphomannomutase [Nitrospirae bacterium]|nr:phosphomannomutase [Nitrospirota bacterium]
MRIEDLMSKSGVKFGTSGARGLALDMTDEVCYAYTAAFIQYLQERGELNPGSVIAIGGDLRSSTRRIMKTVARAVRDRGYTPENCGRLPSPAMAYYGLVKSIPAIMVTGSHIPDDRNGIKFTTKNGEILKQDEIGIKRQEVEIPAGLFDDKGAFSVEIEMPSQNEDASELYIKRYIDFFPDNCLKGKRLGVYQHSAVGRDIMVKIFSNLGADVKPLGISDAFIPVDTEALRQEDINAAAQWVDEYHFDSIISTDGDSDRPLISDEKGRWLRGDVAGILCAAYFNADAVVTPVSSNSAVEKCGLFKKVYRTKIGSPYVIEGMQHALKDGFKLVVGYEANGGFLLGTDIESGGKILKSLPTRDAIILHISILLLSIRKKRTISELLAELPQRFTASSRLKDFPTETSKAKIDELYSGDEAKDRRIIKDVFGKYFGSIASIDAADGLRIIFDSGEIVHLRPSGNAPEFRCYTEADTEAHAAEMNRICMEIMESWR